MVTINLPIIKEVVKRIKDDEITSIAGQLAYYLLLSVFPFMLLLLTLAGHIPLINETLINEIARIVPTNTGDTIQSVISEITAGSNSTVFSFGLITSLWAASKGVNALSKGLNKAYDIEELRPFWKARLTSILFTIGLALLLILAMVFIVFGKPLGDYIFNILGLPYNFVNTIWNWIRYFTPIFAMIVILAALYHFMPNKRLPLRNAIPGAVFTTIVWMGLSVVFSFYVNNISNYSKIYGSIGGIIVLLIWLYWISIIILVGGEINAALVYNQSSKKSRTGQSR